ncbi:MAG: hypothetical protein ACQEQX_05245 [Thermodesulfobacteriota bacterium]
MSARAVIAALFVCAGLFMLVSCQAWHKTRQSFDAQFYPEEVELKKDLDWPESELEAARLFAQADQGLQELLQELQVQEDPPAQGWAEDMLQEQPWLQGMLVLDKEGQVEQSVQAQDLPEEVVQEVLSKEEDWQKLDLRLLLPNFEGQTWMLLARPYQQSREWQGLILAYFRPQDLLQGTDSPGQIILLGQEQVLWNGDYPQAAQGALEQDLPAQLQDEAYGQIDAAGQEFFWLARYVGQDQFFYLLAQ